MRLSTISFAGTARTLVAVGTVSDWSMLATMRAATPRSGTVFAPVGTGVAAFAALPSPAAEGAGAKAFAGAGAAFGGAAAGAPLPEGAGGAAAAGEVVVSRAGL